MHGGLTAERNYTLPKFPSDAGWSLKARLIGGSDPIEIAAENAAGSGPEWTLLIPAASTNSLETGDYTLLVIAFNESVEQLAAKEHVHFFSKDETDLRSQNKKVLDALNDVIDGKAKRDQTSISYNGRSISRMSWEEILKARDALESRLAAEERSLSGEKKIQTVRYRFVK